VLRDWQSRPRGREFRDLRLSLPLLPCTMLCSHLCTHKQAERIPSRELECSQLRGWQVRTDSCAQIVDSTPAAHHRCCHRCASAPLPEKAWLPVCRPCSSVSSQLCHGCLCPLQGPHWQHPGFPALPWLRPATPLRLARTSVSHIHFHLDTKRPLSCCRVQRSCGACCLLACVC